MTTEAQNQDVKDKASSSLSESSNDTPPPPPGGPPNTTPSDGKQKAYRQPSLWLHPITAVSYFILAAIFVLILFNMLDWDRAGILEKLTRIEYARGLITYLFAVGTIGTIIAIMLAILLDDGNVEEKIRRAKDVLTILIGIFGTIIGFYFGAQLSATEPASPATIQIDTPLTLAGSGEDLAAGRPLVISTTLTGGVPPYHYWVFLGSQILEEGETQQEIMASLMVTPTTDNLTIVLFVRDDEGNSAVAETPLPVNESRIPVRIDAIGLAGPSLQIAKTRLLDFIDSINQDPEQIISRLLPKFSLEPAFERLLISN